MPIQTLIKSLKLLLWHELGLDICVILRNVLKEGVSISEVNTSSLDTPDSDGLTSVFRHLKEVFLLQLRLAMRLRLRHLLFI